MNDRPTPETDEAARKGAYLMPGDYSSTQGKQFVHIDFARKLERQRDALREALESLVNRITQIHEDPHYVSVWVSYQIHGGDYTNGPKYDKELTSARAILEAIKPEQMNHILYKTEDDDCPHSILDAHGAVVLDLCRICGLGEQELVDNPECYGVPFKTRLRESTKPKGTE